MSLPKLSLVHKLATFLVFRSLSTCPNLADCAVGSLRGHVSIRESAWKLAVPRLADELKQQGIEQG